MLQIACGHGILLATTSKGGDIPFLDQADRIYNPIRCPVSNQIPPSPSTSKKVLHWSFESFSIIMSLQVDTPPAVVPQKQIASHCIAPLTGDEISHASGLVKALYPSNTSLQFKVVTLQEPPKAEVLLYLEAEHSNGPLPAIERKAWVNYYIRNTV